MIKIRQAESQDVDDIYKLIKELALYEKAPEQVTNTSHQLQIDLFDKKICEAIVAEIDNQVVAFALYYTSYSTWKGASMYLEDFYVSVNLRRKGIGQMLFNEVIRIAKSRKMARMDWQVIDWNSLAISFYKKNNAILEPEWLNGRLFFTY
ncbi:MAG: ribosomal protein S18 acetylase RimI-like enzyme [Lentimonas sp.]|jgi:ribosomal protein S18 acetylase RimI-like enzyme